MLKQKVKLLRVDDTKPYPKRENGEIVYDNQGQPVTGGYRRQLVFESMDLRRDTIPVTLFNEDINTFSFPVGTEGELQFVCEMRESQSQNGESRCYAELRLINFEPC